VLSKQYLYFIIENLERFSLENRFSGSEPDQNFLKKCHLLSDAILA